MGEHENKSAAPAKTAKGPVIRIVQGVETADTWLNYVGMIFTVILMMTTVFQVIARQVFSHPFKGYIDVEEMTMALLVFMSMAYCQLKGGNIRFELFMTKVLKGGIRYYATEIVYLLISLLGFGMIAIFSTQAAIHATVIGDVTTTAHWPIWPAMLGAALGSIFLAITLIVQIMQDAALAASGAGATRERWLED